MVIIYFGIAAVVGSLLRQGRMALWWAVPGFFLFVPASVAIAVPQPWRGACWLVAFLLVCLFFRRPSWLPLRLFSPVLACRYFGTAMYLILLWTILSGQSALWLSLGLPAFAAGYLGWWRASTYQTASREE